MARRRILNLIASLPLALKPALGRARFCGGRQLGKLARFDGGEDLLDIFGAGNALGARSAVCPLRKNLKFIPVDAEGPLKDEGDKVVAVGIGQGVENVVSVGVLQGDGTVGQCEVDELFVLGLCGMDKRAVAPAVFCGKVAPGLGEQIEAGARGFVLQSGKKKGQPVAVFGFEICSAFNKLAQPFGVVGAGGVFGGVVAVAVLLADVLGAGGFEQQIEHGFVGGCGGEHERGDPVLAVVAEHRKRQQGFGKVEFVGADGVHQRGVRRPGWPVLDFGDRQKGLERLARIAGDGVHQRGPLVAVAVIGVGARLQRLAQGFDVVASRGFAQELVGVVFVARALAAPSVFGGILFFLEFLGGLGHGVGGLG